ncbi:type VII secretion protein EsaA [Leifsonia sp. NPDC056665]|uniref:type VII secretion protein EsaA n=1 Tax=Leifsonia sp. NPDC056665 TaxID=3345901 RepID=UPI003685FDA6
MNNDISQRAAVFNPTVALVNEDLASEFNAKAYAFGANFVDRVSKDSEYNWTVLSRPIAEKAYKDGSVDAVIYLPQSFSHDILTLQDLDPTKATVEYKLRPQLDEQSDRVLKSKVVDIVHGFNQSVVTMYYASVADNIAEADSYMHAALGNQEALIAALTSDVEQPFSVTKPSFENFVSNATGLKDVNAATIDAQNSFTESVTDTLARTSETFWAKLPEIDEYASRQQEIAHINATNSNTRITDQAASDRDFYSSQFDALRTSTLCTLSGVDAAEDAEPCTNPEGTVPPHLAGQLLSLRQAIADYSTAYTGPVNELQSTVLIIRTSLTASIANLETLVAILEPLAEPTEPGEPTDPTEPTDPGDPAVPTIDPAVLQTLKADIGALKNARDSLRADNLPAPNFDSNLKDLDAWYADMLATIKGSALTASAVGGLDVTDWADYDPDALGLYIDNSDGLHRSIADLVNQTAETDSRIASGKLAVPDNRSQFDSLLSSALTTFTRSETVRNGVNGLLSTGSTGLGKNQQYYQNFSTVLANTRTQGVDTGKLHDFFSAPIAAKDISAQRTVVPTAFDPKWLIVFACGLLAGVLVAVLSRGFRVKKNG